MPEKTKPQREQRHLLDVEEGDFLRALAKVGRNNIDEALVDTLMKDEEIGLWQVIQVEYEIMQKAVPKMKADQFWFGARYLFLILKELEKEGYSNPKVTTSTAYVYQEEKLVLIEAITKDTRMMNNPVETYDQLEEFSALYDEHEKEEEFKPLTTDDILAQAPFIRPWLESLSLDTRAGVFVLHELKRRQFHADELSRQLGTPTSPKPTQNI